MEGVVHKYNLKYCPELYQHPHTFYCWAKTLRSLSVHKTDAHLSTPGPTILRDLGFLSSPRSSGLIKSLSPLLPPENLRHYWLLRASTPVPIYFAERPFKFLESTHAPYLSGPSLPPRSATLARCLQLWIPLSLE
jgi:hypothetical protein